MTYAYNIRDDKKRETNKLIEYYKANNHFNHQSYE